MDSSSWAFRSRMRSDTSLGDASSTSSEPRQAYGLSVLLWSVAAGLHALVGSVAGFAVARFLLGLGEAGNFPAAVKSAVEYFPSDQRAYAMGWINSGMNVAVQLTPLFIPWIVLRWGWHAAFLATASLGVLWLIAWMLFPYERRKPKVRSRKRCSGFRSCRFWRVARVGAYASRSFSQTPSGGSISTGFPSFSRKIRPHDHADGDASHDHLSLRERRECGRRRAGVGANSLAQC